MPRSTDTQLVLATQGIDPLRGRKHDLPNLRALEQFWIWCAVEVILQ